MHYSNSQGAQSEEGEKEEQLASRTRSSVSRHARLENECLLIVARELPTRVRSPGSSRIDDVRSLTHTHTLRHVVVCPPIRGAVRECARPVHVPVQAGKFTFEAEQVYAICIREAGAVKVQVRTFRARTRSRKNGRPVERDPGARGAVIPPR